MCFKRDDPQVPSLLTRARDWRCHQMSGLIQMNSFHIPAIHKDLSVYWNECPTKDWGTTKYSKSNISFLTNVLIKLTTTFSLLTFTSRQLVKICTPQGKQWFESAHLTWFRNNNKESYTMLPYILNCFLLLLLFFNLSSFSPLLECRMLSAGNAWLFNLSKHFQI